jgi:hypothetical protein
LNLIHTSFSSFSLIFLFFPSPLNSTPSSSFSHLLSFPSLPFLLLLSSSLPPPLVPVLSEGPELKGLEGVSDPESALSCALLKDSSSFARLETDMVLVVSTMSLLLDVLHCTVLYCTILCDSAGERNKEDPSHNPFFLHNSSPYLPLLPVYPFPLHTPSPYLPPPPIYPFAPSPRASVVSRILPDRR